MAIGRISGPMLFSNLERQGVDLAFESNLLYLDVTNRRVGVINTSPQYSFDSSGNAKIANIVIQGNLLSSNTGKVNFGSTANITISGGSANYVLYTDGSGNLNWGEISELDSSWGNISLANNTISITNTDGNLNLNANGAGKVNVSNDFYVTGNLFATNFTGNLAGNGAAFSGNVSADLFLGNIQSYVVNTTFANVINLYSQNLSATNVLIAGGTVSNVNSQINNLSTGNALISGGDISNVNVQANNLSSGNILLTGGIINNVDLQANNFSSANALVTGGVISNVTAQVNNFSTGNALITGGTISSIASANIGNVRIQGIEISSQTGNLLLSPMSSDSNSVVVINGTSALQLPSGSTGQQPAAYAGAIRWNITTASIEFYNGSTWISLLSQINNQTISPDGSSISYTLDYSSTAEGIIVSINGTIQEPGTAYTVAGTTITFAEIPLVTDIISVRYLSAGVVTAENVQEINPGNIALTTGAVLIDSFNKNTYRSAKYMASTTDNAGSAEFSEFAVTQFDTTAAVSNVNRAVTGSTIATISANISGSLVQVYATASSSAQMRIQKTYFIV